MEMNDWEKDVQGPIHSDDKSDVIGRKAHGG